MTAVPRGGAGHRDDYARGAICVTAAGFLFTLEAVLVKAVAGEGGLAIVVFCRAVAQFALIGGLILATRRLDDLRSDRPWLHVARSGLSVLSWFLFYTAFLDVDLALATALSFSSQLFVVALARLVLGEVVGRVRLLATLIGFLGVAIATGLGTATFEWKALYIVASAFCGAGIVFLNRLLTRTERSTTITFYVGLVTTLVSTPPMIALWQPISPWALGLLLLSGALGTIGNFLVTEGYRAAEVSSLAPYPYLKLVYAIVIGYVFFAETPAATTWIGAAVIVAATLAITLAEGRRGG
jgi:drug/metabolite transporter (DMT)-like permease